jgi:hypothetical protein
MATRSSRPVSTLASKTFSSKPRSFGNQFLARDSRCLKFTGPKLHAKSRCLARRRTRNSVSYLFNAGLHILYQKTDGPNFKRNEFANELEVFCKTYFYGPLVIAFSDANAPYRLYDFPP